MHVLEYVKTNLKNYPGNYLEIGVFNGDSIAELGEIYPHKTIYGIDPFIEDGNTYHTTVKQKGEKLENQKQSTLNLIRGKPNVILHEVTSKHFCENTDKNNLEKMNIDVVFIDGDHHYEHVKIDAELALNLIGNKKGLIIFDDTNIKDVSEAISEFEDKIKSRIIDKIFINYGNGILIYIIDKNYETT